MTSAIDDIAAIAARTGLGTAAVQALADALEAGQGGGAQWRHPDLGGMGQWTRGGMLQIGDMFNDGLKARVRAALDDLVQREAAAPQRGADADAPMPTSGAWWPADFGAPAATGAQNGMRYACFPDCKRLVVERDGHSTVYDTGRHRLTGFAQAQGTVQRLSFSGPDGRVDLEDLHPLR